MSEQDVRALVRSVRKFSEVSQEEFAHLIGVTMHTVARWETQRDPDAYALARLYSYLLGGVYPVQIAPSVIVDLKRRIWSALMGELRIDDAKRGGGAAA